MWRRKTSARCSSNCGRWPFLAWINKSYSYGSGSLGHGSIGYGHMTMGDRLAEPRCLAIRSRYHCRNKRSAAGTRSPLATKIHHPFVGLFLIECLLEISVGVGWDKLAGSRFLRSVTISASAGTPECVRQNIVQLGRENVGNQRWRHFVDRLRQLPGTARMLVCRRSPSEPSPRQRGIRRTCHTLF